MLFLLVCLSAFIEPSFFTTILIISSVAWTSIAKFTRGEVIKVKNEDYIQSAKALALDNFQIVRKHILPNALGPVFVSLSFGMAAAILLEASLSFLGMGIAGEEASWGKGGRGGHQFQLITALDDSLQSFSRLTSGAAQA